MHIHIPTPLRAYTGQQATVEVEGITVDAGLRQLTTTHPELQRHLFTEDGKLRSFVNVYLNDEDVRYLPEKEYTITQPTDELSIIPSIAGGCFGVSAARAVTPLEVFR